MADNQQAPEPTNNLNSPSEELNKPQESQEESLKAKESSPFAEQFSRVAKQEKFVAEERKKIEEARKAFEQEKQEVEKYRGLKSKDPFEILEHFGVSYEQLLEADKNRRTTPMDPVARKALETVEQLKLELKQKEEEAHKERTSKAEVKLMSTIDSVIRSEEFDLIEKLGEQAAVRDYMEEVYNETGEIPDIKAACECVNNKLVAKYTAISGSKWLKAKEVAPEVTEEKPKETLSNKMAQSIIHNDKPMNEKERMLAAIAALNAVKSK